MRLAFINFKNHNAKKLGSLVDKIIFIKEKNIEHLVKKYNLKKDDVILVHEEYPLAPKEIIKKIIKNAKDYGACVLGIKTRDTIKEVDENLFVIKTLDRRNFRDILYPRAIRYDMFKKINGDIYNVESLKKLKTKIVEIE